MSETVNSPEKERKHRSDYIANIIFICGTLFCIGCIALAEIRTNNEPMSPEKLKQFTGFEIPYGMLLQLSDGESGDYEVYENGLLQISRVEISNEGFVFRTNSKDTDDYDIMEIDTASKTDITYTSSESEISTVRIRRENETYPHCIIVNWKDENQCYGLMTEKEISDEEMFNLLGVDMSMYEVADN